MNFQLYDFVKISRNISAIIPCITLIVLGNCYADIVNESIQCLRVDDGCPKTERRPELFKRHVILYHKCP